MTTRTVTDSFGTLEVPADTDYGASTARSLIHFAIGQERMPSEVIQAYGIIKRAAAITNGELGELDMRVARLIAQAAELLQAGQLDDKHFPLSMWQSGSGTQTHMNVNEVLARVANRLAEQHTPEAGEEPLPSIHPNDHVNRGQSTNDTFPTAIHLAVVDALQRQLLPTVQRLINTLEAKANEFSHIVKLGRTHLQDATPLTLGQEISGWAAQLAAGRDAIQGSLPGLYELAIGGTAVGTGLNSHPQYAQRVVARIAGITGLPFRPADNRFAAQAGADSCVAASGALRQLATACLKVSNDIRFLASGPRAGFGELRLPANEPGSSIMPGKVNPTQCEVLCMVSCQVMGNDVTVGIAGSQGQFELNTYRPLLAHNLLNSIRLLADATASFNKHCAIGLQANPATIERNVERSLMLITALAPHIGYDEAARIAKHAHAEGTTLKEAATALGLVDAATFDSLVQPAAMVGPTEPQD